jgi:hypothetical protein
MLTTPDAKVLEALVNLENNGNFIIIMNWVKKSKDDAVTQLAVATDVPLYRTQGAFGVLDGLHNHASGAREALAKLSNRSK